MSFLTSIAPPLAAGVVVALGSSWRKRTDYPEASHPHRARNGQRFVYCIWHQQILFQVYFLRHRGVCAGISMHEDGELIARISHRLGFRTGRGSSTRGGSNMVRQLLRHAKEQTGDIVLTPDGPKGPAMVSKAGSLFVASQLGWPIVPCGIAARPAKVLQSWDRFVIPWPFSRVALTGGVPWEVSKAQMREDPDRLCRELDERMAEQQRRAKALLDGEPLS